MTKREKLIEAMARADAYARIERPGDTVFAATAVLEAVEAAGCVVVPREATGEMIDAAYANEKVDSAYKDSNTDFASACYAAMVEASPYKAGETDP